jgi:Peptide N-acetyl-beta-D-glucosaminyl asparaginase amidase A
MKHGVFSTRIAVIAVALGAMAAQPKMARAQDFPIVGSQNTVTADPPVARPNGKRCVVQLYSALQFADFSPKIYQYSPPAGCAGPWEKVIFTADFSVSAGVQFDRTAEVFLGHVNIYYGTTAEPGSTLSPSWHVERDVTDYSALFKSAQAGEVDLGNLVNSEFTGVITGSATLEFFQAQRGRNDSREDGPGDRDDAARTADAVYPLPNAAGGAKALVQTTDQLAETFTLPTNVERAYLDVITQSQSNDEFWYTCVPNDVASELQSCGNTGFREAEISVDGQPAGVAPVYPWIYTGGIDPFLWAPLPGVQTLNFVPYRVDLTPFAGMLSNGQAHTVAVSVFNADNLFLATATLLIFQDHGATQVTGAVTANTIGAAPTPKVVENLQTDAAGDITGTVNVSSTREFHVAGFVKTSHGRVDTDVHQNVNFSNAQTFAVNATSFVQDIAQRTFVDSRTITTGGGDIFATLQTFQYPLTLNISEVFAADGSLSIQTTAAQEFQRDILEPFFDSTVDNKVNSTDTLQLDSSFNLVGHTGQQSSQKYTYADSRGGQYSCKLAAANSVLTFISEGCPGTK